MKVTILGASGKIGSMLVMEMLHRGHEVTAFCFEQSPFDDISRLKVVKGDVHNSSDLEKAVNNSDVILSALGSWGTQSKDILSSAMKNLVPILEKKQILRIISLTGADARDIGDKPNLLQKLSHVFFSRIAKDIMQDGEEHLATLRSSSLDWTVVRSPVMSNNGTHGIYKLRNKLAKPWHTIHRVDVVNAMAGLAESRDFIKSSPVIYRR